MSIQARLATALVLAAAVSTPAIACGPAPTPEHVTGTVDAFDAQTLRGAIHPTYARTWDVIVQYPHYAKSGAYLYQGNFRVSVAQARRLADALRAQAATGHMASLTVELEQVSRDEWRLVSFRPV
jgi:hypothetical protein